jgi:hypothetical protein
LPDPVSAARDDSAFPGRHIGVLPGFVFASSPVLGDRSPHRPKTGIISKIF